MAIEYLLRVTTTACVMSHQACTPARGRPNLQHACYQGGCLRGMVACAEGSPGHSRPASRAATEAESDEPETEDSGKSNGEGSGSDAWSVISNPGHGIQQPVTAAAQVPGQATDRADPAKAAQPSHQVQQPAVSTSENPAADIQVQGSPNKIGKQNAIAAAVSAPAHDPKSATAVKPEDSDADDLSDLSGSEAAGPMSEAEEDWGTWE